MEEQTRRIITQAQAFIARDGPYLILIGLLALLTIYTVIEAENHTQKLHDYYNQELQLRNCKDQKPIPIYNAWNETIIIKNLQKTIP